MKSVKTDGHQRGCCNELGCCSCVCDKAYRHEAEEQEAAQQQQPTGPQPVEIITYSCTEHVCVTGEFTTKLGWLSVLLILIYRTVGIHTRFCFNGEPTESGSAVIHGVIHMRGVVGVVGHQWVARLLRRKRYTD